MFFCCGWLVFHLVSAMLFYAKSEKSWRKICGIEKVVLTLHRKRGITPLGKWFHVRVVRYRSAKPFTAVRIRLEPQGFPNNGKPYFLHF